MPIRCKHLIPIILLLFVGLLCVFSAGDRLAQMEGHTQSRLSPSWFGPGNAEDNALRAIDQDDFESARHWSSIAVARDPLGEHSTSLLALALLGSGQAAAAQRAYTVAAMTGWRDAGVQIYWMMTGLAVGDLTVAAQRLDALLRTGNRDAQTISGLEALEATAAGRRAIADRLRLSPDWASWYLLSLGDLQNNDLSHRMAVIAAASRHGLEPDRRQAARAATALRVNGQADAAVALWRLLGGAQNTGLVIADGGFENKANDRVSGPFEWALIATGGVDVRIVDDSPLHTGAALYVRSTATATKRVAQQAMTLAPGLYMVRWRSTDGAGKRSRDADVRVLCNGSTPTAAADGAPRETGRNGSVSAFAIPATGCRSQLVVIEAHPSASPSPSPTWIDDISIARSAAAS